MTAKPIPADIGDHLRYDPETGLLYWLTTTGRAVAGQVAGTLSGTGYVGLKFRGIGYQAHRVAWFLMTGKQPGEIDHANRAKADNRWVNLRDVSHQQNCQNRDAPAGKHGRGITRRTTGYRATVWREGRNHHVGVFPTEAEAASARAKALTSPTRPLEQESDR